MQRVETDLLPCNRANLNLSTWANRWDDSSNGKYYDDI